MTTLPGNSWWNEYLSAAWSKPYAMNWPKETECYKNWVDGKCTVFPLLHPHCWALFR